MKNRLKSIVLFVAIMMFITFLVGCSNKESTKKISEDTPLAELNKEDITIGVGSGTVYDQIAQKYLPKAKMEYGASIADLIEMAKQNKIDCFIYDEPLTRVMKKSHPEIISLKEIVVEDAYAWATPKTAEGKALNEDLCAFIEAKKASGEMKVSEDKWFGDDEEAKIIEPLPEGKNGVLRITGDFTCMPFTYVKDNQFVGQHLELITEFCKENGYSMELTESTVADGIAGIGSRFDLLISPISVTEERKEIVDFTDVLYNGGVVVNIIDEEAASENLIESIKGSFYRNFIQEDRWKLVARGIEQTVFITLMSAFLGTILGYLLYLACRKGNKIILALTGVYDWLMRGMPVVVLMMILFYVVFASTSLSGTWIAIVGFTLVTGSSVYGMLCTGVNAIDPGQMEGALSLGYDDKQAFKKFVLPQAVKVILPSYCGELVSLVKGTAVVGYITVQDLTKVTDIIRSRTFEALFPLIVTAIIYFILGWLLTKLIQLITKRIDTRNRKESDILKGIQMVEVNK